MMYIFEKRKKNGVDIEICRTNWGVYLSSDVGIELESDEAEVINRLH